MYKFGHICVMVFTHYVYSPMGLLSDTQNYGLRMRRECRERKWSRHASRHVRDARAVMHTGIAD